MKSLMLLSVMSCMLVGQVYCGDGNDVPNNASAHAELDWQFTKGAMYQPFNSVRTGLMAGAVAALPFGIVLPVHAFFSRDARLFKEALQGTLAMGAFGFSLGYIGRTVYGLYDEGTQIYRLAKKDAAEVAWHCGALTSNVAVLAVLALVVLTPK